MQETGIPARWRRVLIGLGVVLLAGCASGPREDAQLASPVGGTRSAGAVRTAPDPMALGRSDAPVGLVAFSDYQCPYCQEFHQDVWPQLRRQYVDTGKLRFMFRDLPLAHHREATNAAVAARCAAAQDRFWPMNAALFEHQSQLAAGLYPQLARELKLDPERFAACLRDPATRQQVQRDVQDAQRHGISGTPNFLLGRYDDRGLRIERVFRGLVGFEVLAREIDALLAAPAP